jgi:uncharacterized protein YdeI (YjbR/CyaY-like superfamily)
MNAMNPEVDKYLIDGCMRCKYGGTPQCKVLNWTEELKLLRKLVLETGLTEEIKGGLPVYTKNGKNIVSVNALKGSANLSFFKGVLLSDAHKLLKQQGNIQSGRIIYFTKAEEIHQLKKILKLYIEEAITIEDSGMKVQLNNNPEPVPVELEQVFAKDPNLKEAFYKLTPGRQRGYIIHFSQPKQTQTRIARIEKYRKQILNAKGLND